MSNSSKKKRTAISVVLAFFTGLFFCGILISAQVLLGFCSTKVLMSSQETSHYYEKAYEAVKTEIDGAVEAAGLPAGLAEGVITQEGVYMDGANFTKKVMRGIDAEIDTGELEDNVRGKIQAYLTKNKIDTANADVSSVVDSIAAKAGSVYKNKVSFAFAEQFYKYTGKLRNAMYIAVAAAAVLTALSAFLLLRMYKHKHRAMRFFSAGLLGGLLAYAACAVTAWVTQPFGISVTPQFYMDFIAEFVRESLEPCIIVFCVGLVLYLASELCTAALKKRRS